MRGVFPIRSHDLQADGQAALATPDRFRGRQIRLPLRRGGGVDPSKSQTLPLNIAKWFDLTRPGRYFIQATVKGGNLKDTVEKHTSNVLTIDIVEPNLR